MYESHIPKLQIFFRNLWKLGMAMRIWRMHIKNSTLWQNSKLSGCNWWIGLPPIAYCSWLQQFDTIFLWVCIDFMVILIVEFQNGDEKLVRFLKTQRYDRIQNCSDATDELDCPPVAYCSWMQQFDTIFLWVFVDFTLIVKLIVEFQVGDEKLINFCLIN